MELRASNSGGAEPTPQASNSVGAEPTPRANAERVAAPERGVVGYHITMRPADERGIARSTAQLRLASRLLHQHGSSRGLLAFRIADNHLHALVACSRGDAGQLARCAQSALTQRLGLPAGFEPARIRPVVDERHLANALRYLFRQEEHHGTAFDRAHDGSSLVDLLGLRRIGAEGCAQRLSALLPRLERATLVQWLAVDGWASSAPHLHLLPDAAAAALGLADLQGKSEQRARARHAAAHAAGLLPRAALGALLGAAVSTIGRLRQTPADPALVRAVALQWQLRSALHTRSAGRGAFEIG